MKSLYPTPSRLTPSHPTSLDSTSLQPTLQQRIWGRLHLRRDTWLFIGLIVLLLGVSIAAGIQQMQKPPDPPLYSLSNTPDGAHALRLWLDALSYHTSDQNDVIFTIPADTRLMLMLEPTTDIQDDEWKTIDDWVNDGGTLLIAGEGWPAELAVRHYKFGLDYILNSVEAQSLQTPLLVSPPITATVKVHAQTYLSTQRQDYISYLALGPAKGALLASFTQGKGLVILSSTPFLFSNAGLKEAGNPELVLNLLSSAPPLSGVWFDEWHHGIRPTQQEIIGPEEWLRYTPAGRSLLFVAAVILLALLLQGRAFGRPVPLMKDILRRRPLEYITALANLSRRAGHRSAVARHFYQQIKRNLGKRYRIDPTLSDEEYVGLLAQARPDLDAPALLALLKKLERGFAAPGAHLSEKDMLQLARQAAHWTQENTHE